MGKFKQWCKVNLPRLFRVSYDGGQDSGVTGYWLIEWKPVFSIVLLRFSKGTRDAYHEHAFNAWTFWVKGRVQEEFVDGSPTIEWTPSFKPKYTPRSNFHRIRALETSWALCFRGRWNKTWKEKKGTALYTLTHGRVKVADHGSHPQEVK